MSLFLKNLRFFLLLLLTTVLTILYSCHTAGKKLLADTVNTHNTINHAANTLAIADTLPEENRFSKIILSDDLDEPMELALLPNGNVLFIERKGRLLLFNPAQNLTKTLHRFNFTPIALDELNGLLGITIHPDFSSNHFIYLYHTVNEGKQEVQHLSRYMLQDDDAVLNTATEKILLKIPVDHSGRTHTGGSMAWDRDKNLYLSTGDNTFAGESGGYGPMDERPGRIGFDAQRSSANTNDLRGKILRIHPEPDGTYTIPKGNLFVPGTGKTRPEIYVMGCRNPYRIAVDTATSILYWGEVGPDAYFSGKRGPVGHDEVNQAKQAGNYGWPYFVADNKPYAAYNFETKVTGSLFDPAAPVNHSVNNTGLVSLPPAQKAMIWYPYAKSEEFPLMEAGGRSAMAGPMYHYNASSAPAGKFPRYYDGKLFTFDWMRKLVFAVTLDGNNNYAGMERFLPATGNFIRPIDMEFAADGTLYILEYGTVYGADNPDARLVRITFNTGNRAPVAHISATGPVGPAPLMVPFGSDKSFDFDRGDKLSYSWDFGDGSKSTETSPSHTYTAKGIYHAVLKVADEQGKSSMDTIRIVSGNSAPKVDIAVSGNSTFFFAEKDARKYVVTVTDKEDKFISKKDVKVYFNFLQDGSYTPGNTKEHPAVNTGETLIAQYDCMACHQVDKKIVGPAFIDVSKKYKPDVATVAKLANKVITGGSGVWGNDAMNGHPQLPKSDAEKIVRYILSLSRQSVKKIPMQGNIELDKHTLVPGKGLYVLNAAYTDKGNGVTPLTTTANFILRPTVITAEEVDSVSNIVINHSDKADLFRQHSYLDGIYNGSYFMLKDIDLSGINGLTMFYGTNVANTVTQVRLGSPGGTIIATLNYTPTGGIQRFMKLAASLKAITGRHDIYFVFENKVTKNIPLAAIRSVTFNSDKL